MQRSSRLLLRGIALSFLIVTCGGAAALAAPKQKDLQSVERQIEQEKERKKVLEAQSRKLLLETAALRRELIGAARNAQEKEGLLTRLEGQLSELVREAETREKALAAQRQQLAGTLGALGRLSRNTPQALLFFPGEPTDVVRSAMLLRITIPRLGDRAATLAREIESLSVVKKDIASKLLSLRQASAALDEERAGLRQLLGRKSTLRRETETAYRKNTRRMRDLAAKARNLRELMARLHNDSDEKAPESQPPAAAAPPEKPEEKTARAPAPLPDSPSGPPGGLRVFPERGPLTLPVRGRLVGRYGESTNFGNTAKGIRLETRFDAQVVAPFDGKVVFAGPFRNYGQILIIEHRGGYHTLLAGLARIDAVVGQWLLAGEPLGAMATRKTEKPVLYVELRRNGQPINPLPWITAEKQRVRG
ncbi:MAG: peptidoglycan DD-metalloendopeptidase family protein [Alphaproteobacteria bacterium]|nr:peptidoglycan DD-metalloendopeptidase family protein [Alphaproteobacteria bacterium]